MNVFVGLICAAAAGYQVIALLACFRHYFRRRQAHGRDLPPVSILKPVYGADPQFYDAIRSHAQLHYSSFELLFGVRDLSDSAVPHIERLQAEYPNIPIRLIQCTTSAPNGKVGILIDLAQQARHDVLVVNDSDIKVELDYLRQITSEIAQPGVGLVTCLYRATAGTLPPRIEALGISTDFAPSTLVAPLVGINEFGLGSTLCLRRQDLDRIGGFGTLADYIADDYQLGRQISRFGLKVILSSAVVETHLGVGTWRDVWHHQVRWARTIRLSRGAYAGLPITNATLWAVLAAITGNWLLGAALLTLRLTMGILSGWLILRDPLVPRWWWLIPFRDMFGFAVWVAGMTGRRVRWRGSRMTLDSQGRITAATPDRL